MPTFPTKTMLAAATFAAILLAVHYATGSAKGLDPSSLRPITDFPSGESSLVPIVKLPPPPVPAVLAVPKPKIRGHAAVAAILTLDSQFLVDNNGALDHFYESLRQLRSGQRAAPSASFTTETRPRLPTLSPAMPAICSRSASETRGPGFILIAKPWAWYGHHGVDVSGDGWKIDTAVGSMREANYGLGGAIFTGPVGATSTFHLSAHDSTSIEVQYLAEPNGGTLEISADGQSAAPSLPLPTRNRTPPLRFLSPPAPDVSSSPSLAAQSSSSGWSSAATTRGLTYDSIGLNGASTTVMSRAFNPATFAVALEHRNPDLVVINYGTNESGFPSYVEKQYEGS